jgi:hypothetical protein
MIGIRSENETIQGPKNLNYPAAVSGSPTVVSIGRRKFTVVLRVVVTG